jgi:hypothetical protein
MVGNEYQERKPTVTVERIADRREHALGDIPRLRRAEPIERIALDKRPEIGNLLPVRIDNGNEISTIDANRTPGLRRDNDMNGR